MASSLGALRTFYFGVIIVTMSFLSVEAEAVSVNTSKTPGPIHPTTVQLAINGSVLIATIGDEFICATIDWWPATKCNYGTCPWYSTSMLNLDLANPILEEAIIALAPLRVRLGGTLQDLIVYDIGSPSEPCLPLVVNNSAVFGFSGGCLPIQRWDVLNQFFIKTGASVAFGLNPLYGRTSKVGWNSSNAADLIRYTHNQGYPVTAWELGNELLGSNNIGVSIAPQLYAEDIKLLRSIVNDVYQNDTRKPLVIAPDAFYEVANPAYQEFLADSGTNVVDVVTRHIYNLGPGVTTTEDLVNRILSPVYANGEEARYRGLQTILRAYPWASAWVGESGGAYNSGHKNVTDAFIMAFWYLDQLGLASKHKNQAFCRQTLIGGHYGLLDAVSFVPNPDFYGALLWQKLMGTGVLSVNVNSPDIRAYAHCQKDSSEGGVTVLLLNYSNVTSHSVDVSVLSNSSIPTGAQVKRRLAQVSRTLQGEQLNATIPRQEYHMSPAGSDIHSNVVLLNGTPLRLTASGTIPVVAPEAVNSSTPVTLGPLTYAFVVIPDASAPACVSE